MQQAGINSICTEERGKKLWQLQIYVQILVVSGVIPPLCPAWSLSRMCCNYLVCDDVNDTGEGGCGVVFAIQDGCSFPWLLAWHIYVYNIYVYSQAGYASHTNWRFGQTHVITLWSLILWEVHAVLIATVHCIDAGYASWGACSVDCYCALHRCWLCFMGCMQCWLLLCTA